MPERKGIAKAWAAVFFTVCFLLAPAALLAQVADFDVPNVEANPGSDVSLSVSFDSQGADVCAVSADVTFDGSKLMWVGGEAGPSGSASQKRLMSQTLGTNGVRVGLIGMNSTRIPNGVVMVLRFKVAPNASGAISLNYKYGAASCGGQDLSATTGTSYISLGGGDCKVTCLPMAAPTSGSSPLSVLFNSHAQSTCKGEIAYHWQFGDGTSSSEPTPSHTYNNPGQYRFSIEVTSENEKCVKEGLIQVDDSQQGGSPEQGDTTAQPGQTSQSGQVGSQGSGATNADQAAEVVEEPSDEASAETEPQAGQEKEVKPLGVKIVITPKKGPSPLKARLRASISGGKPPYKVTWNYGDKSEAGKKASVLHTYEKPGKYKPSVEVKDSGDGSASTTGEEILVQDPPVAELQQLWLEPGEGVVTLEFVGTKFQKGCTASIGGKKYDTEFVDSKRVRIKDFPDPKGVELRGSLTNPYGKPSAEVKAEPKPKQEEGAAKGQETAATP